MRVTMKQISYAVIIINLLIGAVLIGKYSTPIVPRHEILHEVSMRYLKVFKSPKTVEEQAVFEYITKGRLETEGVKIDEVISSPPAFEIVIK